MYILSIYLLITVQVRNLKPDSLHIFKVQCCKVHERQCEYGEETATIDTYYNGMQRLA